MGEIIFSLCVGGFLAISGIIMIIVLTREERRYVTKDSASASPSEK